MPVDLGEMLGGILAGIAEARSLGDRYSRNLAVQYEQDDLLKTFPVPRAEIANLEMNLNFSIQDFRSIAVPEVSALVARTTSAAAGAVANVLKDVKIRRSRASLEKLIADAVQTEIERSTTIALAMPPPGRAEAFDLESVTEAVVKPLDEAKVIKPDSNLTKRISEALGPVRESHAAGVQDLRSERLFSGKLLNVLVTHGEIAELPPSAVSSVKITINLRNYEWTQTDVKNGEPVRKLVRE